MTAATAPRNAGSKRLAAGPARDHLRLWLRMLRVTRKIEAELRRRLAAEFDATLPRFDVMAALYQVSSDRTGGGQKGPGLTMTELSRRLEVSNGNVTGIVERLVKEGHVLRSIPDGDRRASVVRLTEAGRERFEIIAAVHNAWIDELLADVSPDEAAGVISLFDRLIARKR